MRHLINMTINDSDAINRVASNNKDALNGFELDIKNYDIRYSFNGLNAIIKCEWQNEAFKVNFAQEASALLAVKKLPSFEMVANFDHGKAKIIKAPKGSDARMWLAQKTGNVRTCADEILYLVFHASFALNVLNGILQRREYNDTIEYKLPANFEPVANEYLKLKMAERRKAHRFDGWDVVTLTDNQLRKLGETLEEHHIQHDFNNVSLPKFCLDLYDTKGKFHQYYFMEYHVNSIHFEIEDDRSTPKAYCDVHIKRRADGQLELELDDNTNAMTWLTMLGKNEEDAEQITHWQWMMDMFFSINSFLLNFGDVTMEVETKEATAPSNTHSRKKNARNSVRLFKSYKLIKGWKSKARKKAEITCLAWGVRGHFRHLRNGKVIFIDSYIKGKEKDKYKGKEYVLLPYKDA